VTNLTPEIIRGFLKSHEAEIKAQIGPSGYRLEVPMNAHKPHLHVFVFSNPEKEVPAHVTIDTPDGPLDIPIIMEIQYAPFVAREQST
jgi:hypothetical protein